MAEEVTDDVDMSDLTAKRLSPPTASFLATSTTVSNTAATAVMVHPYQKLFHRVLNENRTVIAASAAAVCGVVAGFPFDSVKTRMQTHSYNSVLDCVRKTYFEEGLRGFFRGIIPPLITISIIKSISFSVYVDTKNRLSTSVPALDGRALGSLVAVSSIAGAASGAVIASLSCPLELVKIQKQLEQLLLTSMATGGIVMGGNREARRVVIVPGVATASAVPVQEVKLTSSWHSAKEIMKQKGLVGLYKGFSLHLARDTLGTAVYFGSYETVKRLLTTPNVPPGPLTHFSAGGICGIFCWLVVFPIDLVKSILQKQVMQPYTDGPRGDSIPALARDIYARGGFRGLYQGLGVTLIRAFPIHSLNFLVYEQVLKMIRVELGESVGNGRMVKGAKMAGGAGT